MLIKADVRVVVLCGRGGQEDQVCVQAGGAMGVRDEGFADPLALVGFIDGEVGEVSTIVVICDCPGDADQQARLGSGGDEDIGMFKHAGDGF